MPGNLWGRMPVSQDDWVDALATRYKAKIVTRKTGARVLTLAHIAALLPLLQRHYIWRPAACLIPGIDGPFLALPVLNNGGPVRITTVEERAARGASCDLVMLQPAARLQIAQEVIRIGRFIDAIHLALDAGLAELHFRLVPNADGCGASLFEDCNRSPQSVPLPICATATVLQKIPDALFIFRGKRNLCSVMAFIAVTDAESLCRSHSDGKHQTYKGASTQEFYQIATPRSKRISL